MRSGRKTSTLSHRSFSSTTIISALRYQKPQSSALKTSIIYLKIEKLLMKIHLNRMCILALRSHFDNLYSNQRISLFLHIERWPIRLNVLTPIIRQLLINRFPILGGLMMTHKFQWHPSSQAAEPRKATQIN